MESGTTHFKHNILASAVLMALGTLGNAQAAVIQANGTIDLGFNTPGDTISGTFVDGPVSTGNVDIIPFLGDANGNSGFIHTFGSVDGNFGSRSSGEGDHDVFGAFNFTETFTNTTGSAQNVDFSFTVIPGSIQVGSFGSILTAGQQAGANISIDITVNGMSIFDSFTQLLLTGDGMTNTTTFTETGTSLGGTQTGNSYSYNSFTQLVDLGTLGIGESLDFDYTLSTRAFGNFNAGCFGGEFGGEGGEGGIEELPRVTVPGDGCADTFVNSGDPLAINGTPNTFTFNVTTAVPEPASVFLFGAGLAGLGFARRRKQK